MNSMKPIEILIKRVERLYKNSSIELRVKAGLKMSVWYIAEEVIKKDDVRN